MTCKCGRQTNNSDGVCAICHLKANDPDTIQGLGVRRHKGTKAQRHKEQKRKNNIPNSLICLQCKKSYKPTSSAQKRCSECKKSINRQPSNVNCKIEGCKNPIKAQGLCNKHYLQKLKDEGRIGIRKNPLYESSTNPKDASQKSQVSCPKDASQKRKKAGNGSLAQMLYVSNLLDNQISSIFKDGSIDVKIILDIRFRLGIIMNI